MDLDFDDENVVEKITKRNKRKQKTAAPETTEENNKRIKVSQAFLADYGPQLNYSFNLWKQNSKILERATIDDMLTGNPMKWSVKKVSSFIEKITGDETLALAFQEQEIDGAAFISMCKDDLVELMKIKIGVAIKIYNRILYLREEVMLKFMDI